MTGHTFRATTAWQAEGDFAAGRYSRVHVWRFDGGVSVPASASPTNVPPPYSRDDAVDPEEAFVASLSSCHMLWFLYLAHKAGFTIISYEDEAEGTMGRIERGRQAFTRVVLRPRIVFDGRTPDKTELDDLHHRAHNLCFIANSVKSEIVVESRD